MQVIAPAESVYIQDFSRKIKLRAKLTLHAFRIHFRNGNSSRSTLRLRKIRYFTSFKRKMKKQPAKLSDFIFGNLGKRFVYGKMCFLE